MQATDIKALVIHAPHDLRLENIAADTKTLGPHDVKVRMAAGGICGHEASGYVEAVGSAVTHVKPKDLVAVNPSHPCGTCPSCKDNQKQHCENMLFNGSAMRFPHVQGLFREFITVPQTRVFPLDPSISPAEASLCEPFSVTLHAANQAGDLMGKTVLVSGCGPIGILAIVSAKLAGAKRIIATDITAHSLKVAKDFGCDDCIDVSKNTDGLTSFTENRGQIDVAFECSGNPHAMKSALTTLKPRGRMVLVGLGGDAELPMNMIVAKELSIIGTFRFNEEFARAAELISSKEVDLKPMLSATFPMTEAKDAFALASDRSRATKVVIALS
jgi:L-idonate 5-dehydrogenase